MTTKTSLSTSLSAQSGIFGLIAEFDNAKDLLAAAQKARGAGYEKMRAYTPYYVEGLGDVLGHRSNFAVWVWICLVALVVGGVLAFALQYYTDVIDYPINVAGRPFNSWPAFLLIVFELAILVAGITLTVAMLVLNNFPLPYHPIFNAPRIELASRSHFFLCIEVSDPRFDLQGTKQFLQSLNPRNVSEVPC